MTNEISFLFRVLASSDQQDLRNRGWDVDGMKAALAEEFAQIDSNAAVMKTKAEKLGLTYVELNALDAFKTQHGRSWKKELTDQWRKGIAGPVLQGLRNTRGPSWLAKVKI